MRIITGSARGCRLKTPKGQETRPTSDRVKESLFNILGQKVSGRHVLDIFAGTGNLGLEALSRDAADACFVDQATAALIKENAAHAHLLERAEVHGGDVFAELSRFARAGRSFDLIFCDPPYHKGLFEQALVFFDESQVSLSIISKQGITGSTPDFIIKNSNGTYACRIYFFKTFFSNIIFN